MEKEINQALSQLLYYLDRFGLEGYDPYDALNSPPLLKLGNKWLRVIPTVFFRLSPINLRKIFRIRKGINPKAMGLLLSSYSLLHKMNRISSLETADQIFDWLCQNPSPGYSGYCWGYNFPWQSKARLLDRGVPTIVNTSFIGHGILDYFERTNKKKALEVARSACNFILKDLNIRETEHGICFSYTPVENHIVHNANVLGASLLARVYTHTHENELLDRAKNSFDFTLHHQMESGLWDYSAIPETGQVRIQTDWHQGFILDSLMWFIRAVNPSDEKYKKSLSLGAEFYKTQFTDDGMCFWRHPKMWPVDIHNQAQGIITFARLEEFLPGSIQMAGRIARWTTGNLRNKKRGYFYYQKWPLFTNRIPYLRWGQAWMLLALVIHLANSRSS